MNVPFHIEMRVLYPTPPKEKMEHELSFGVVGVDNPIRVVIESELYDAPRIVQRITRGSHELDDKICDALALKAFDLMASLICSMDGDSAWWTIADITGFIRKQFKKEDADRMLRELATHVDPAVLPIKSICLVADDDAI